MTLFDRTSFISFDIQAGRTTSGFLALPFAITGDEYRVLREDTGEDVSATLEVLGSENRNGIVTLAQAPSETTRYRLVRATPLTQETDYSAERAFPIEAHEFNMDRLFKAAQETRDIVRLALGLGVKFDNEFAPMRDFIGEMTFTRSNGAVQLIRPSDKFKIDVNNIVDINALKGDTGERGPQGKFRVFLFQSVAHGAAKPVRPIARTFNGRTFQNTGSWSSTFPANNDPLLYDVYESFATFDPLDNSQTGWSEVFKVDGEVDPLSLITVARDATLTGDGTTTDPLGVAVNAIDSTRIQDGAVLKNKLSAIIQAAIDKIDQPFTSAEKAKLAGVEANAAARQTATEIIAVLDTHFGSSAWRSGAGLSVGSSLFGDGTTANPLGIANDAIDSPKIQDEAVIKSKLSTALQAAIDSIEEQFTGAEKAKLADIEDNATADQTALEIIELLDNHFGSEDWRTGGVVSLANGSIITDMLADKAVTGAKIADLTIEKTHLSQSLLNELTSGGSGNIPDSSITSDKIANDAILERHLDDQLLIALKASGVFVSSPITGDGSTEHPLGLALGGLTSDFIGNGSIITDKLRDGAVTPAKLDPNLLALIQAGGTGGGGGTTLIDGIITSNYIADGAVLTSKLADRAVTPDKMALGTPNKLLGYDAAGVPTVLDAQQSETGQSISDKLDSYLNGTTWRFGLTGSDIRQRLDGVLGGSAWRTNIIGNNAITRAMLQDNIVDHHKLADNAVLKANLSAALQTSIDKIDQTYTLAEKTKLAGLSDSGGALSGQDIIGLIDGVIGSGWQEGGTETTGGPVTLTAGLVYTANGGLNLGYGFSRRAGTNNSYLKGGSIDPEPPDSFLVVYKHSDETIQFFVKDGTKEIGSIEFNGKSFDLTKNFEDTSTGNLWVENGQAYDQYTSATLTGDDLAAWPDAENETLEFSVKHTDGTYYMGSEATPVEDTGLSALELIQAKDLLGELTFSHTEISGARVTLEAVTYRRIASLGNTSILSISQAAGKIENGGNLEAIAFDTTNDRLTVYVTTDTMPNQLAYVRVGSERWRLTQGWLQDGSVYHNNLSATPALKALLESGETLVLDIVNFDGDSIIGIESQQLLTGITPSDLWNFPEVPDNSIHTRHIAPLAVHTAEINDDAVIGSKIRDGEVSLSKLSQDARNELGKQEFPHGLVDKSKSVNLLAEESDGALLTIGDLRQTALGKLLYFGLGTHVGSVNENLDPVIGIGQDKFAVHATSGKVVEKAYLDGQEFDVSPAGVTEELSVEAPDIKIEGDPIPRLTNGVVLKLSDGRTLIHGGRVNGSGSGTNSAWIINAEGTVATKMTVTGTGSGTIYNHVPVILSDNRILFVGGTFTGSSNDRILIATISGNTMTITGAGPNNSTLRSNLRRKTSGHYAVRLYEDTILVGGGEGPNFVMDIGETNAVPNSNHATLLAALTTRYAGIALKLTDGNILLLDGYSDSSLNGHQNTCDFITVSGRTVSVVTRNLVRKFTGDNIETISAVRPLTGTTFEGLVVRPGFNLVTKNVFTIGATDITYADGDIVGEGSITPIAFHEDFLIAQTALMLQGLSTVWTGFKKIVLDDYSATSRDLTVNDQGSTDHTSMTALDDGRLLVLSGANAYIVNSDGTQTDNINTSGKRFIGGITRKLSDGRIIAGTFQNGNSAFSLLRVSGETLEIQSTTGNIHTGIYHGFSMVGPLADGRTLVFGGSVGLTRTTNYLFLSVTNNVLSFDSHDVDAGARDFEIVVQSASLVNDGKVHSYSGDGYFSVSAISGNDVADETNLNFAKHIYPTSLTQKAMLVPLSATEYFIMLTNGQGTIVNFARKTSTNVSNVVLRKVDVGSGAVEALSIVDEVIYALIKDASSSYRLISFSREDLEHKNIENTLPNFGARWGDHLLTLDDGRLLLINRDSGSGYDAYFIAADLSSAKKVANFPGIILNESTATTVLNDGRIFVMTRRSTSSGPAYLLEIEGDEISSTQVSILTGHTYFKPKLVTLEDGSVLQYGGFDRRDTSDPTNYAFIHTIAGNTVTSRNIGRLSKTRGEHSMVAIGGNKALVFGGKTTLSDSSTTNEAFIISKDSDTALSIEREQVLSDIGARYDFEMQRLPSGSVLIFGGRNASNQNLNDVYLVDPSDYSIEAFGNQSHLAAKYASSSTVLLDGTVLSIGGASSTILPDINTLEIETVTSTITVFNQTSIAYDWPAAAQSILDNLEVGQHIFVGFQFTDGTQVGKHGDAILKSLDATNLIALDNKTDLTKGQFKDFFTITFHDRGFYTSAILTGLHSGSSPDTQYIQELSSDDLTVREDIATELIARAKQIRIGGHTHNITNLRINTSGTLGFDASGKKTILGRTFVRMMFDGLTNTDIPNTTATVSFKDALGDDIHLVTIVPENVFLDVQSRTQIHLLESADLSQISTQGIYELDPTKTLENAPEEDGVGGILIVDVAIQNGFVSGTVHDINPNYALRDNDPPLNDFHTGFILSKDVTAFAGDSEITVGNNQSNAQIRINGKAIPFAIKYEREITDTVTPDGKTQIDLFFADEDTLTLPNSIAMYFGGHTYNLRRQTAQLSGYSINGKPVTRFWRINERPDDIVNDANDRVGLNIWSNGGQFAFGQSINVPGIHQLYFGASGMIAMRFAPNATEESGVTAPWLITRPAYSKAEIHTSSGPELPSTGVPGEEFVLTEVHGQKKPGRYIYYAKADGSGYDWFVNLPAGAAVGFLADSGPHFPPNPTNNQVYELLNTEIDDNPGATFVARQFGPSNVQRGIDTLGVSISGVQGSLDQSSANVKLIESSTNGVDHYDAHHRITRIWDKTAKTVRTVELTDLNAGDNPREFYARQDGTETYPVGGTTYKVWILQDRNRRDITEETFQVGHIYRIQINYTDGTKQWANIVYAPGTYIYKAALERWVLQS